MTHRILSSVLVGASCCAVLLGSGEVSPALAGGQPKIKGKPTVPQGNQKQKRKWEPLPWEDFGGWHGGGFGGHTGGLGHSGGIGVFGGHIGGLRAVGALPSITGALGLAPGVNAFGGLGVPGFGDGPRERRSREEALLLGSLGGFAPGLDLMRDPVMGLIYPEDDVIQLLRLAGSPTLPTPSSRVMNSLLMLDDDLAPFGTARRGRGGLPGLRGEMPGMLGGFDAFAQLRMSESLNRPMNYTRGLGFAPGHSSNVARLLQLIEGPGYRLDPTYTGNYGGGYGGFGLGGLRGVDFWGDPGMPSYGPGLYLPGMPRRGGGFGGVGGFGPGFGGFGGWGRPVVIAPPPPRPRGPSAGEQRAAMEKFHKSLVSVEAMARVGAWDALADGLSKTLQGSSLPSEVAAPLKGLQAEAGRLTDLFKLREALARGWDAAPDAAALSLQLDSLRKATGDADLADRLARLLAVKAAWEGHGAAAAALSLSGEGPDVDAELADLRKPRSGGTESTSITTHDERELARRRVARGVLEEIDHHIDCGRFTAAVLTREIREMRVNAKELAGLAPRKSTAGSPTATASAVRKALGRNLTETEAAVLRKMHAAGKSVEAIVEVLR